MKYIKILVSCLLGVALLSTTSFGEEESLWNLTLSGAGSSTVKDTATSFGGELGIGHTGQFLLPFEAGVRQSFSYASGKTVGVSVPSKYCEGQNRVGYLKTDNALVCSTRLYSDFTVLPLGNLQVAAGLGGGATYGDTTLVWSVGPEVVARLFLKKDVYLFGRAQYDVVLNGRTDIRQTGNDSAKFAVGLGVRF